MCSISCGRTSHQPTSAFFCRTGATWMVRFLSVLPEIYIAQGLGMCDRLCTLFSGHGCFIFHAWSGEGRLPINHWHKYCFRYTWWIVITFGSKAAFARLEQILKKWSETNEVPKHFIAIVTILRERGSEQAGDFLSSRYFLLKMCIVGISPWTQAETKSGHSIWHHHYLQIVISRNRTDILSNLLSILIIYFL